MAAGKAHASANGATSARLWTRVQQLAHIIGHDEAHYVKLLVDSELPTLLVECIELLRLRPDSDRLQQITTILLQMIEKPDQLSRNTASFTHLEMMKHARDWAIETLLDIHTTFNNSSSNDSTINDKLPVQNLQTSLCTYSSLNVSSHLVDEMQEAIFTSFALQQVQLEDYAYTQVLELCASSIQDDLKCALFLDAMLTSRSTFPVSQAFLGRLFKTENRDLVLSSTSGNSSQNGDYGASPRGGAVTENPAAWRLWTIVN